MMKKIQANEYDQIPIYEDVALESFQDGYIPVSRIEHWQDIKPLLLSWRSKPFIFRGHKESHWSLSSSFSRLCNNPEEKEANELLDLFRNALEDMDLRDSSGNYYHQYDNDHLWGLGRHYGLLTPTLDWSHDPLVALFFAFEDPDNDVRNPYAAIYFLDRKYVEKNLQNKIVIIDSISPDNSRAINQKGLFTRTTSDDSVEAELKNLDNIHLYFRKLYIKNTDRKNCIHFLEKHGIHKKSLYPNSIEGAVHYSNLKAQKFFRKIFPGGPIISIVQQVMNASAEVEKIAKSIKSDKNLQNSEVVIAAKYIFEVMHQLKKEYSSDVDFLKKLDKFYKKKFSD